MLRRSSHLESWCPGPLQGNEDFPRGLTAGGEGQEVSARLVSPAAALVLPCTACGLWDCVCGLAGEGLNMPYLKILRDAFPEHWCGFPRSRRGLSWIKEP